ncbi:hypothetical protein HOG75_03100, partial [bacterium]|nr:hypothetical protein [bacterium]
MFQKILLTLFFLCLSFSVSLAEKNATTLGFSLGGNHLTGLHFETYNRQHSYKFDIGTWNFQDISIGNQIKLYFKYLETSFYTGSGISFHLVFNNGFGYFVSLNLPLGIEWSLNNNSALGIGL